MIKLFTWAKKKTCEHIFDLQDLKQTGRPEPKRPENNDYEGWRKWYAEYYKSDHVTRRVVWSCCKCGEVFYAYCGLDIYKHGKPK